MKLSNDYDDEVDPSTCSQPVPATRLFWRRLEDLRQRKESYLESQQIQKYTHITPQSWFSIRDDLLARSVPSPSVSSVSTIAFVTGTANVNLVFAKKHSSSGSGGDNKNKSSKDSGSNNGGSGSSGGSSDSSLSTSSPSANIDQGSSGGGEQGGGATGGSNGGGNPPNDNSNPTTYAPSDNTRGSTGQNQSQPGPTQQQQQQCAIGEHFDGNTNVCVNDKVPAQSQQPTQGLIGSDSVLKNKDLTSYSCIP